MTSRHTIPKYLALLGQADEIVIKNKGWSIYANLQHSELMINNSHTGARITAPMQIRTWNLCTDSAGKKLFLLAGHDHYKSTALPKNNEVNRCKKMFKTWDGNNATETVRMKSKINRTASYSAVGPVARIYYTSDKWDDYDRYVHSFNENKTKAELSRQKDSAHVYVCSTRKININNLTAINHRRIARDLTAAIEKGVIIISGGDLQVTAEGITG